jgi:hypothetical protein
MSDNTQMQGHVFKVKHPNGVDWIEIPILYQTMYQAYVDYCKDNNVPVILSQVEYYIMLGELKGLREALEEYVNILQDQSSQPLSRTKGGTGVSVDTVSELAEYLGLTSNLDDTSGNKFPNTVVVKGAITQSATDTYNTLKQELDSSILTVNQTINNAFNDFGLDDLGISAGTKKPDENTPGTIYIKYSE